MTYWTPNTQGLQQPIQIQQPGGQSATATFQPQATLVQGQQLHNQQNQPSSLTARAGTSPQPMAAIIPAGTPLPIHPLSTPPEGMNGTNGTQSVVVLSGQPPAQNNVQQHPIALVPQAIAFANASHAFAPIVVQNAEFVTFALQT